MPQDNTLGNYINFTRKQKKLSIKIVAESAGIDPGYLSKIEKGFRNPSAKVLKKIAEVLNISYESLLEKAGLTTNNENNDINEMISATLEKLENEYEGLMFNGEPLDNRTRELLKISLENSIKIALANKTKK